MRNVLIVGGGLAGLVAAVQLARSGIRCTVVEKRSYPIHKVCGEYVSNEVMPFLKRNDLFPDNLALPRIRRFCLSSVSGRTGTIDLGMGGFGISRFVFDHFLYEKAVAAGVEFYLNTEVHSVEFGEQGFTIATAANTFHADVVIGAFGKRSRLDMAMRRAFISTRSPYTAVKYHIRTQHPDDLISLHNFEGGYCGVSKVENGVTNLCYLVHRDKLRQAGSVAALEESCLSQNPALNAVLRNSEVLFKEPKVINEISFATKEPIHNHVLFAGDAAGMVAPLFGNGMAMAIHSAFILADVVKDYCREKIDRHEMEATYAGMWRSTFGMRLRYGRMIQRLFGVSHTSGFLTALVIHLPSIARQMIRLTHGKGF